MNKHDEQVSNEGGSLCILNSEMGQESLGGDQW